MGNKPSSSSQSTDLLATFTSDEQAQIKQQYAKAVGQSNSPDKHSKTATLPRATFEHVLCPHVDEALRTAIAGHLVEMSNTNNDVITQEGFIRGAHSLARENKAESIYFLYTKVSPSLQQFVTHVIDSALPFWWQGSTLSTEKWDSNENRHACKQLADYLVFGKPPAQAKSWTEDDLFSTGSTEANSSWNDETTHNVSADTFQAWLTGNMEFNLLIDILMCSIFWPESADRDKARTQHYLAPAMDKPKLPNTDSFSNLLDPYMYYLLTLHMPVDCLAGTHPNKAVPHSLLFSSKTDGKSWQNFANNIVNRGALVIVIKTSDGVVFGGYTDEPLQLLTRWTGNGNNFLFRQSPMGLWDATNGTNDHYQYLCWGKKSLPNGFGMGGQFDYCGLWIGADFSHGHSKAGPLCTTYMSPRLSSQEDFTIDQVEAWLVRPIPIDENNPDGRSQGSVLNHAEEMAFLEMAGRKMYSKDVREADQKQKDTDSS